MSHTNVEFGEGAPDREAVLSAVDEDHPQPRRDPPGGAPRGASLMHSGRVPATMSTSGDEPSAASAKPRGVRTNAHAGDASVCVAREHRRPLSCA